MVLGGTDGGSLRPVTMFTAWARGGASERQEEAELDGVSEAEEQRASGTRVDIFREFLRSVKCGERLWVPATVSVEWWGPL